MSQPAPVTRDDRTAVAGPAVGEASVGELITSVQRDLSSLVKQEIDLAKSELKVNVKMGGLSVALFGAAAFLMLLAVIMLSIGLAYLINLTGLDLVWCFLLVFLLYTLLAGLLGFVGYRKVRQVRGPQRAIHQAQETKETLLNRR
jgi:ABC-type multidrug transport system fused ATPase/permease subunit